MQLTNEQLNLIVQRGLAKKETSQKVRTLIEHEAASVLNEHREQLDIAEKLAYGYWKYHGSVARHCSLQEYSTACHASLPLLEENRIAEFAQDHVKSVIQAAVAWTVKIGGDVGLVVGVPAGEAAEVAVDAFFAAESVVAVTNALSAIWDASDEFSELLKNLAQIDLSLGPEAIYNAVLSIVGQVIKMSKKAGVSIEEYLNQASEKVEALVKKTAKSVSKGLGVIIPIPGIDIAIFEGLMALGTNAFDIVSKVYSMLPESLQNLLKNPGDIEKFLNDIIQMVSDFIAHLSGEDKDEGFVDDLKDKIYHALPGASVIGAISNFLDIGPRIVEFLQEKGPKIAAAMASLFTQVVPFMFAALAFYQIVAKREWESLVDKPEEGEEKPSAEFRASIPDKYASGGEADKLKKAAQ